MSHILLIGLGGALGAVTRHTVTQVTVMHLGSSIIGTFIVNISGTFLLGLLVGVLASHPMWPTEMRMLLAVGFLASYTTFSTLGVATINSLGNGDLSNAAINLGASVLLGLVAAVAGLMLGRAI